jgi:tRNA G18 (ribose-2'-O)-methylase SpoU
VFHVGYTAHPPNAKLEKTALGTIPYVPWEHTLSVETALAQVRSENIPIIALETTDRSKPLWEVRFPLPVCLVVGNEALGVSRAALRLSDQVVEIPMLGFKNSINVAVAFGIAVYEIQRQHWAEIQKQAGLPNAPSGSAG